MYVNHFGLPCNLSLIIWAVAMAVCDEFKLFIHENVDPKGKGGGRWAGTLITVPLAPPSNGSYPAANPACRAADAWGPNGEADIMWGGRWMRMTGPSGKVNTGSCFSSWPLYSSSSLPKSLEMLKESLDEEELAGAMLDGLQMDTGG